MVKKIICMIMVVAMCLGFFSGCELPEYSFESRCTTSTDGFVYYIDSKIGLCIIKLPDSDEVIIPEFINDKPVKQLGYKEVATGNMQTHKVDGSKVKKLTIQHTMDYYSVSFPNVETLIYVDVLYCKNFGENTATRIDNYLRSPSNYVSVELKKLNKIILSTRNKVGFTNAKITTVYIPKIVSEISKDAFLHSDVSIVTSYSSKPEGWVDGWSGNCEVEWGAEL